MSKPRARLLTRYEKKNNIFLESKDMTITDHVPQGYLEKTGKRALLFLMGSGKRFILETDKSDLCNYRFVIDVDISKLRFIDPKYRGEINPENLDTETAYVIPELKEFSETYQLIKCYDGKLRPFMLSAARDEKGDPLIITYPAAAREHHDKLEYQQYVDRITAKVEEIENGVIAQIPQTTTRILNQLRNDFPDDTVPKIEVPDEPKKDNVQKKIEEEVYVDDIDIQFPNIKKGNRNGNLRKM